MPDDLLVRLMDSWDILDRFPDELSLEFGKGSEDDDPVIYFRWFDTNREKIYGYTKERYEEVWGRFNRYWYSRKLAGYELSIVK
jgi:hypothetical protein